jgi:hypothetical protein
VRGDYFNGGSVTLFRLMEVLAEQFGADNVRLSVWFDELSGAKLSNWLSTTFQVGVAFCSICFGVAFGVY